MSDSKKVSRKKLYDQVWEKPMTHLAKEYGISDVGLKKICKKMEIPTPGLGYWAKLEHGKKVQKQRLPQLSKNGVEKTIISAVYSNAQKTPPISDEQKVRVEEALKAVLSEESPHLSIENSRKSFEAASKASGEISWAVCRSTKSAKFCRGAGAKFGSYEIS